MPTQRTQYLLDGLNRAKDHTVSDVDSSPTPRGLDPYSQNIRTRLPTGDYASTIIRARACLLLPSHPYSAPRGTAKPEGEMMDWKQLLASITGTVDQELLLRNEYRL